jgi:glycerophosphoryl diester phosphodiesterase
MKSVPGLWRGRSRAAHPSGVNSVYGSEIGPLAVAHRGGAGLAPENTMAAFDRSYALGIRYLETDVRLSADGVCLAFHDADTSRLLGVRGRIGELDHRAATRLRVHGREPVVRLDEGLRAFPDARFTIDLKDPAAIGPLTATIRRCGATDRVCIAGNADHWLADIRSTLGPEVATAMGWESLIRLVVAARSGTRPRGIMPAPFAHLPLRMGGIPLIGERLISLAHDLGTRVLVWTVDVPRSMNRLLDLGVDGIISDRPDLLREELIARGQWQTPVPTPRRPHGSGPLPGRDLSPRTTDPSGTGPAVAADR